MAGLTASGSFATGSQKTSASNIQSEKRVFFAFELPSSKKGASLIFKVI